jgi:oligopeptide/dipeptide ABC transporter ATP-binding protein
MSALATNETARPISEAIGLKISYPLASTGWGRGSAPQFIKAVDGVDLAIAPGEAVALVGESGCGKSSLGRALLRLEDVSGGTVRFDGRDMTGLSQKTLRPLRRGMQMVFQDPFSSLNPRMRIGETLAEPLKVHGIETWQRAREAVAEILEVVGLERRVAERYPHEFSGGQRQRIAIARAVIARPKFVVADEPISALDISVQAQILDLFEDLKAQFSLTYLFISHDLAVVRHIADRVAVMYLGRIVEEGDPGEVFDRPLHPYTQALLDAVPVPDPKKERHRAIAGLIGDPPSPAMAFQGCRFASRCPHAMDICRQADPALKQATAGHAVACWLHD